MFEKNLNDLVRGLRNNKNNESKFVTECLDEIKQELRQENMAMKANAVLKLSYIQMLGYDISWAAFNIIEVMSSPKFTHKRISYMAASQCFHTELDVLMLATNLIKKDMNSQNQYDAGSAMVGLSCFVSPDLARDLANDIMSMMVSSRPYIRKRAILLMYKVFLNFPEALRPAFPRLKERLEDPDQGVQCAAVNVICELARKNPKNYLALAPLFFKLMTTSSNNWMLIKIIKLFGALCPLEPRLGKKLLEPLTSLIHRSASNIKKSRQEREFVIAAKKMLDVKSTYTNGGTSRHGSPSHSTSHKDELAYCITGISTSAMSLLYECINTVISGLPDHQASMQLCVSKLRLLIEDQDQNLKYLGLLLLNKILKAQPKIVIGHKDLILQCLDDRDESIRYRALDLIVGMISKKTLMDIIKKLMVHMEKAEGSIYRDELLAKIIEMCSQSNFQYITNFEWYIDVLLQLSDVEGTKHGRLIANQMLDVAIRVKAVRQYAVPVFSSLLAKPSLMTSTNEKNTSAEVLFAAAWVAGEYAEFLTDIHTTVASLVNPKVKSLPAHIQCVYIQAIGKLFSRVLTNVETDEGDDEEIEKMSESLVAALPVFTQSSDLEVQDRSCCVMQLIKLVMKMKKEGVQCAADVKALFAEELLPVAPKAQKKVPVPEGLDLDKWINEPLSDDESDDDDVKPYFMDSNISSPLGSAGQKEKYYEPDEEELERAREIRRMFQESNPHYLKGSMTNKKSEESASNGQQGSDVTDIPVKELDLSVSLKIQGEKGRKGKKRGKKGKKGRHASESEEEPAGPAYEIAPVIDLAGDEVVGDNDMSNDDPHDALNIDLDTPLGADEVLPVQTHRIVTEKSPEPSNSEKKKTKKSKTSKDGKKRTKSKDGETDKEKTGKKDKSGKKSKKRTSSLNKEKLNKEEAERKATLLKLASQAGEQSKTSNANKESDDMEFWLSPTSTNTQENGEANTAVVSNEKEIEKTSEEKPEKEAGENTATNEKNTKKKSRKEKTSKEKTGKEKKKKTIKGGGESSETPQEPPPDVMIMDLEEPQQDPYVHYKELCRDGNIQLLYEIRCDPIQNTQVICSTIFRNLTPNHIQKLEFNVLDSLNMKLIRQVGAAAHEPVLVPFQLLPNMTNEGQFAFTVDSVVMSQFLRGTLTYILKEADGSTSEKLDFRLSFPVSSFFHTHVITSDEFTSLLASGELKEKQSIKLDVSENLDVVVDKLSKSLRITVVEKIEGGVSMYGETVQKHALCLLLKKIDDNKISIDGKSGDFQLLSSIMKELKSSLEGS